MSDESISVSEVIPADPDQIYAAWLSTEDHTSFTGDKAVIEPYVGGKHSSFGGYAVGTTVELDPGRRIVQTWRSRDFPEHSPDSRVEVTLEERGDGTLVTILHTEIPESQSESYRDGWVKHYLEPLKRFFGASEEPTGDDESDGDADDGGSGIDVSDGDLEIEEHGAAGENGAPITTRLPPPPPPPRKKSAVAAAAPKTRARKAPPPQKKKAAAPAKRAAAARKPARPQKKKAAARKPAARVATARKPAARGSKPKLRKAAARSGKTPGNKKRARPAASPGRGRGRGKGRK